MPDNGVELPGVSMKTLPLPPTRSVTDHPAKVPVSKFPFVMSSTGVALAAVAKHNRAAEVKRANVVRCIVRVIHVSFVS